MCVHVHTNACCLQRPEEGVIYSGIGVIAGHGFRFEPGSSGEQLVLLTVEPAF